MAITVTMGLLGEYSEFKSLNQNSVSEIALDVFGHLDLPNVDKDCFGLFIETNDASVYVGFNQQLDPSFASDLSIIAAYQAGFISKLSASMGA